MSTNQPAPAEKTPLNPSRSATARVKDPLPVPTFCPNCAGVVKLVSNAEIYGVEYGEWPWAYRCIRPGCDSYVGLHPFTAIPLGTLAQAPTREARKRAKAIFTKLWQRSGGHAMTRSEAYLWLAQRLGLPPRQCHIGWFNVATCEQVVEICAKELALAKPAAPAAPKFNRKDLLARVYNYAKQRWCWDDRPFLEEMFDRAYQAGEDPRHFVDRLAIKYDLTDPRAVGVR